MAEENVQISAANGAEHNELEPASSPGVKRWSNRQQRIMRYIIAGLCFASELLHLWLLPGQYEVFSVYGIVFLLIAMAQGFLSINFLFEPNRRIITFGLWINILVAFLYIFTHTIGVLVGLAFLPLPLDVFGVIATATEILAVGFLFALRRNYRKEKKRRKVRRSKSVAIV